MKRGEPLLKAKGLGQLELFMPGGAPRAHEVLPERFRIVPGPRFKRSLLRPALDHTRMHFDAAHFLNPFQNEATDRP